MKGERKTLEGLASFFTNAILDLDEPPQKIVLYGKEVSIANQLKELISQSLSQKGYLIPCFVSEPEDNSEEVYTIDLTYFS